ncbi:MAG: hypothetical protein GY699_23235 [Desulfobacteraceae bacterium]|nr:hypothetical protein [Desulfobacteraceae bacterium]
MKRLLAVLFSFLLFIGCTATSPIVVHPVSEKKPSENKPKKILFLPVDIRIYELTAGGITEEVPAWSEKGKLFIEKTVREYFTGHSDSVLLKYPEFTIEHQKLLDQYVSLYGLVAANALNFKNHKAWEEFRKKGRYTLGNGLSFLGEISDADAVLIVEGKNYISTTGGKAASFFSAVLGVYAPSGRSILHAGIVDIKTGDILWMNTNMDEKLPLNNEKNARAMVDTVFSDCIVTK